MQGKAKPCDGHLSPGGEQTECPPLPCAQHREGAFPSVIVLAFYDTGFYARPKLFTLVTSECLFLGSDS